MFKTRLLSGIVLIVLLLVFILMGGYLLQAGVCIISLIGMYELYSVFNIQKTIIGYVGYVSCVLFYYRQYVFFWLDSNDYILFMIYMIAILIVFVASYPKYDTTKTIVAFFGLLYVAVMLSFIYELRAAGDIGFYFVWLIFIASWGCDTCAYCVGVLFGKHKMAPVLSPKKSIEGAIGGVIGAAIIAVVYAIAMKNRINLDSTVIIIMVVATVFGAVISMIGDLAASAIKRFHGIKDYGKIIPGHGGILDRFDSVIIVAPVMYFFYSIYIYVIRLGDII